MENKILITGTTVIADKEIRIVEGGFGQGQKCILASDIAIQHDIRLDKVNALINSNIERFGENDLIDFLKPSGGFRDFAKENGLMTSNRTKNIFLLSERGYSKLVSAMDNSNNKKWIIMDKLVDDYFSMREQLQVSRKALLLEAIYNGGIDAVSASKQLVEIETKEAVITAVKPLNDKIQATEQVYTLIDEFLSSNNVYDVDSVSKSLAIKGLGKNNLYKYLRENDIMMTDIYTDYKGVKKSGIKHFEVYAKYINAQQYFIHRQRDFQMGREVVKQDYALFTAKGVNWLVKRLIKEGKMELQNIDSIIEKLKNKVA